MKNIFNLGPGTCPYGKRCRFKHVDAKSEPKSNKEFLQTSCCSKLVAAAHMKDDEDVKPVFGPSDKKELSPLSKPPREILFYDDDSDSDEDDDDDDDKKDDPSDENNTDANNNSVYNFPSVVFCGECGANFNTKEDPEGLENHYMEMFMKMDKEHLTFLHNDDRYKHQTSCGVCGRVLARSHSLLSHIKDKIKTKKEGWKDHKEFLHSILTGFTDRDYGLHSEEEAKDWLLMHLVHDYVGGSDGDSDDSDDLSGLFGLMALKNHLHGHGLFEDDDSDDNYGNLWGMDDDDIFELACQGIKPWDPEAGMALAVLNGDFDYDDDEEEEEKKEEEDV